MIWIMLSGAMIGLGVFVAVLFLRAPATTGRAAVAVLVNRDVAQAKAQAKLRRQRGEKSSDLAPGGVMWQLGRWARERAEALGRPLPPSLASNLLLVRRSVETHLAISMLAAAGGAVIGLMFPLPLVAMAGLPVASCLLGALLGLVLGALLPTARLASAANLRRRDFRHVVGSFLDLVAMNLAGGRGVPEALGSASTISDGWAMVMLRENLQDARLHGETPWSALGRLGECIGVRELQDLEAALDLVADDGAKVRESLAARAASLRRRELADAEGRAAARSQSMLLAQLMLALGFLLFLIYPAMVRVLGT